MLMKQMEQIEDTEVEIDVANVERNHRYILLAKKLLKQSLKTLSKTPGLKLIKSKNIHVYYLIC